MDRAGMVERGADQCLAVKPGADAAAGAERRPCAIALASSMARSWSAWAGVSTGRGSCGAAG